ncbi:hypothetical protein FRB90_004505 [Tulasnella sp. 427]|nr:hypothetical protein FRB90_004505 [Tulasnella sp. 427]
MKFVEFAGADAEDESTDVRMPNPNAEKANRQQAQSLESLLMTKNKRLLDEVTRFRIMYTELEASVQGIKDSLDHCRSELDKQRQLNEKLEADLMQVNPNATSTDRQLSGGALGFGGTPGTSTPQDGLAGLNLGQKSLDVSRRDSPAPVASADASILPIVTSQRDRFRQRNAELEEELRKQYEIISELRSEIKTLQADNMKLYEKVRYMQSYRDAGPNTTLTTSAAAIGSGPSDGISKYSSMYEQSMNPFEAFRGREAARAVQALNPLERGVFVITRQILGNRRARMAFIFYALVLHFLVLMTSYGCATSSPVPPHVAPT